MDTGPQSDPVIVEPAEDPFKRTAPTPAPAAPAPARRERVPA